MHRRHFLSNTTLKLAAAASLVSILAACGGNSDPVPSATLEVVPALGAVYNADVTVLNATGGVLGSGSTGSTGKASVKLYGSTTGPIVVKLSLTTASSYFNEMGTGSIDPIAPSQVTNLLAVIPSLSASVGVTPLTNTAAKFAGLDPLTVGTTAITGLTTTKINQGAAATLLALGLPPTFPIFAAPIPATPTNKNPADLYGGFLAKLGAAATTSPLAQAVAIAGAVSSTGITNRSVFDSANNLLQRIPSLGVTLATPELNPDQTVLNNAAAAVSSTFVPAGSTGATGGTGGSGSGGGSL